MKSIVITINFNKPQVRYLDTDEIEELQESVSELVDDLYISVDDLDENIPVDVSIKLI